MSSLFGLSGLIDPSDLAKLMFRFLLNLVFSTLLIRGLYFRVYKNREYVLTFYLLNLVTFSLCLLLRKVPAHTGFALAIFAVFGILRFRTEQMRTLDLTYLFVAIGIGIVNSFSNKAVSLLELIVVNVLFVAVTAVLEYGPFFGPRECSSPLNYDNLALLHPDQRENLILDLRKRTGLPVTRVKIGRFDLLRDSVDLRVIHVGGKEEEFFD